MADRYWVGGDGELVDDAHWAATSGGVGGAGTPGTSDNAIFDENSFTAPGTITADTLTPVSILSVANFDASALTFDVIVLFTAGAGHTDLITSAGFVGSKHLILQVSDYGVINANLISFTGDVDPNGTQFNVKQVFLTAASLLSSIILPGQARLYLIGAFDANDNDITAGAIWLNPASADTVHMGNGVWTAAPVSTPDGDLVIYQCFRVVIDGSNGTILGEGSTLVIDLSQFTDNTTGSAQLIAAGNVLNDCVVKGDGENNKVLLITSPDLPGTGPFFNNFTATVSPLSIFLDQATSSPDGLTVSYTPADGYAGDGVLTLRGHDDQLIVIDTIGGVPHSRINAGHTDISYTYVAHNIATGNSPFIDGIGGVDGGENIDWLFLGGSLPAFTPSIISAVARVEQGLAAPTFVIGGLNETGSYALFKKSDSYSFSLWRSSRYRYDSPFLVEEILLSLSKPLAAGMIIVPVLVFDNDRRRQAGTAIMLGNYDAGARFVKLGPGNFDYHSHGKGDFYLELQQLGSVLVDVKLPIYIDVDTDDNP